MDHRGTRLTLAILSCAALLAGCGIPPEARRDLPPVSTGPAPSLAPTASFDAPRARVARSSEELSDGASDLDLRADRLRSQADALAAPVLTDAERDRLAAGT